MGINLEVIKSDKSVSSNFVGFTNYLIPLSPYALRLFIRDLIERFPPRITRRFAEIFFDP